jgi:hypothetical protein
VKVFIGKVAARCIRCATNDWQVAEAQQPVNVLSELRCTSCGWTSTYGDLALRAPLESDEPARPE